MLCLSRTDDLSKNMMGPSACLLALVVVLVSQECGIASDLLGWGKERKRVSMRGFYLALRTLNIS